jgi:hypothetical protein
MSSTLQPKTFLELSRRFSQKARFGNSNNCYGYWESALRILGRGQALAVADASRAKATVRLLATTERLKQELRESDHGLELALLRSLWKRARGALHTGIVADLDALPPGIGGAQGATALLDTLQARQILVWRRLGEGITMRDATRPVGD